MGSADVIRSPGNPTEDSFITVAKKKRGDVGAVKSSDNTKIARRFRAPVHGVCNTSFISVVPKRIKTKSLFIARFSPKVFACDIGNSVKEQLQRSSIVCVYIYYYLLQLGFHPVAVVLH